MTWPMGTGLRKAQAPHPSPLNSERETRLQVEAVFKAIDTDGNGSIDIAEFLSAFSVARRHHWG